MDEKLTVVVATETDPDRAEEPSALALAPRRRMLLPPSGRIMTAAEGRVVRYEADRHRLVVQRSVEPREETGRAPRDGLGPHRESAGGYSRSSSDGEDACPHCGGSLPARGRTNNGSKREYFRLLGGALPQSGLPRPINAAAINQGYYAHFFRELRQLGKGLRGSVFLVQHHLESVTLGLYAIKKIPTGDDQRWMLRMLREVNVLEQLRHPNIIVYHHCWLERHQLTRFGPPVPCLFVLMELADGGNLEEYVLRDAEGPRDLPTLLALFADTCRGLAYLHAHQILHRDLKPANMQLMSDPDAPAGRSLRAVLSDFGECQQQSQSHNAESRTGATGTLEFVAPELVLERNERGEPVGEHSAAADMWSLGITLHFMCTGGRTPYAQVDDVDLLLLEMQKLFGESGPSSPSPVLPATPVRSERHAEEAALATRIMRMLLRRDPRERATIGEVLRVLDDFALAKPAAAKRKQRGRGRPSLIHRLRRALTYDRLAVSLNTGALLLCSYPLMPSPRLMAAFAAYLAVRQQRAVPALRTWILDLVCFAVILALQFGVFS